jgi:DNA (cytosine-5)-methyltransferase 1
MEKDWNKQASLILRSVLTRKDVKYQDLVERLEKIGIKETQSSITNKLSRGSFSFAFFLQCMEVLDIKEIRMN